MGSGFAEEVWFYLRYCVVVVLPGTRPPSYTAHGIEAQPVNAASSEAKQMIVDEGRRQLDRQLSSMEAIRTRSQFLVTTGIAGGIVSVTAVTFAAREGATDALVVATLGSLLILLGVVGAVALVAGRKDFKNIDVALLSTGPLIDVLDELANAYPRSVGTGEDTLAAAITVFRDATLLCVIGIACAAAAWTMAAA